MSKQSKIFGTRNTFEICFSSKAQSQTFLPSSAEKGKSFYQAHDANTKTKKSKIKQEDQFYLPYRDKRQQNNFLGFYRMKSLMFPVSNLTASELKSFKVIGTMDKKIIVAFNQNLKIFCFFDQHAMHERIRYEYYLECLSAYDNQSAKKRGWKSLIIQKNGKQINLISDIKHSYISFKVTRQFDQEISNDVFVKKYGFEVQYFKEEMTLKVSKVPKVLQRPIDHKLIFGIAQDIILKKSHLPKCFESIIAQISCKSAYKFNDVIQLQVINELISNLSLCQYPFFCVHGRPTLFTRI